MMWHMCVCFVLQLEAAQAAAAELAAAAAAAPPDTQQYRRSCTSIAEIADPDLSADGDSSTAAGNSPQKLQQQQHHAEQQPIKSMSLADSLSAAFSNATNGFTLSGPKGDGADQHEQQQQPPRQQTPPAMSPFALARKFVADREADAVARLKVGIAVWRWWCGGGGGVVAVMVVWWWWSEEGPLGGSCLQ
jgi:hypothetical protein